MYSNVYIENDVPLEKRNYQAKQFCVKLVRKQYRFSGGRLVPKNAMEQQRTAASTSDILRLGVWKCMGWSLSDNDNSGFRKAVLNYPNCEVYVYGKLFTRQ